jgi:hypothetical protein
MAFAATPGTPSVITSINLEGVLSVAVNSSVIVNPTSLTIGADNSTVYVTTRGNGAAISGQILKIEGLIAGSSG